MAEIRQILDSQQFEDFCNLQVQQFHRGQEPAVVIEWNGMAMINPLLDSKLNEYVDSLSYYGVQKVYEFINQYIMHLGGWEQLNL